jgi:hypothetical protein
MSPELAEKRRNDLQAKVAEIETEFIPAVPAVAPEQANSAAPPPVATQPPSTAPVASPPPPSTPVATSPPAPSAPVVELGESLGRPEADAQRAAETPSRPDATHAPVVEPIDAPRATAVPSVEAPTAPSQAAPRAVPTGRIEPQLDATLPEAGAPARAEARFSGAGAAEPHISAASGPAEPRFSTAAEPTLAGSPPPRRAQAERPVPEAFFPDLSDFEVEARPTGKPDNSAEVSAADGPNVNAERRRPLAGLFIGVTLLALVGIGVWWSISTGLIKLPGAPDKSIVEEVPAEGDDFTPGEETPQPGSEGAPQKPGEVDAERAWIPIFSPADPSTLNAPSDAKAELISEDTGDFVRIRSGASGSAIAFDISKGVLEQIAGKHVRFDIVARAEEGQETEFSVDCNFAELGDCGRRRFPADYEKRDFLFEIDLPAKAPGAEGTIAIISDLDKSGKALDIYEIRASISE